MTFTAKMTENLILFEIAMKYKKDGYRQQNVRQFLQSA